MPTPEHKIYSLRHSFKQWMVELEVNEETIALLMGHTNDKPKYGHGGSLEFKLKIMNRLKLEYNKDIFKV